VGETEDKLKVLEEKISIVETEYNKMRTLQDSITNKAADSTRRNLEVSYGHNSLTVTPLQTSKTVYSLWKRSSKNSKYIEAGKKVRKIVGKLGKKLSALQEERRQLYELIEIRDSGIRREKRKERRRMGGFR
jgi:hypothetical protein